MSMQVAKGNGRTRCNNVLRSDKMWFWKRREFEDYRYWVNKIF